ncbi:MAG: hypothetical protein C4519_21365 [Desulfobacteraceae bacterium]|nr:MAG: hypothetical protein C4519_21365 [Desulfobacteraceae bacterium]
MISPVKSGRFSFFVYKRRLSSIEPPAILGCFNSAVAGSRAEFFRKANTPPSKGEVTKSALPPFV